MSHTAACHGMLYNDPYSVNSPPVYFISDALCIGQEYRSYFCVPVSKADESNLILKVSDLL